MAHTTWTSPLGFTNEANFRTWAGGISAALTAIGMQLVDSSQGTGGINWSTATGLTTGLSPTFTAYSGTPSPREIAWEVWRFPTAGEGGGIHGTSPLYLRFGYGQRTSSTTPSLTLTIGTAYVSGGAVTGIGGISAMQLDPSSTSSTTWSHWAACDGNGLVLVMGHDSTTPGVRHFIAVDRHRTPTGTPNVAASGPNAGWSTGVAVYRLAAAGSVSAWHLDPIEDDGVNVIGTAPCVTRGGFSGVGSYQNALGQTELYPWWSITKSGHGVSKMVACYATADLAGVGTEQPVLFLPTTTTRTMKLVGTAVSSATLDAENSASGGLAVATWWAD